MSDEIDKLIAGQREMTPEEAKALGEFTEQQLADAKFGRCVKCGVKLVLIQETHCCGCGDRTILGTIFPNESTDIERQLTAATERADKAERNSAIWKQLGESAINEAKECLKEREKAMASGGFCDAHKPNGGHRNCLVCACMALTHALSRICMTIEGESDACSYDLHYVEEEVVKQVNQVVKDRDEARAELDELKISKDFEAAFSDKLRRERDDLERQLATLKAATKRLRDASNRFLNAFCESWKDMDGIVPEVELAIAALPPL